MSEQLKPEMFMARIVGFCKLLPNEGVSNFVLQGPISQEDRLVKTAAGLFPPVGFSISPTSAIATAEHTEKGKMSEYHSRILNLSMSERILDLNIPDDRAIREEMTKFCKRMGYPTIAIVFGKYRDSGLDYVTLHSVAGISPQTALQEFKKKSRQRLSILN